MKAATVRATITVSVTYVLYNVRYAWNSIKGKPKLRAAGQKLLEELNVKGVTASMPRCLIKVIRAYAPPFAKPPPPSFIFTTPFSIPHSHRHLPASICPHSPSTTSPPSSLSLHPPTPAHPSPLHPPPPHPIIARARASPRRSSRRTDAALQTRRCRRGAAAMQPSISWRPRCVCIYIAH